MHRTWADATRAARQLILLNGYHIAPREEFREVHFRPESLTNPALVVEALATNVVHDLDADLMRSVRVVPVNEHGKPVRAIVATAYAVEFVFQPVSFYNTRA